MADLMKREMGNFWSNSFGARASKRRMAIVIPVVAVLMAVGGLNSVANVTRVINPALALRFFPYDIDANARLADQLVQEQGTGKMRQAESGALLALSRTPLSPIALRVLGLTQSKEQSERGRRLIALAEQLSRRDPITQLWLLQDDVQRGDVPAALDHYDKAMRVSIATQSILFPVLANALEDPEFFAPVLDIARRKPAWFPDFTSWSAQHGKAIVPLALMLPRLNSFGRQADQAMILSISNALISTGQIQRARSLILSHHSRAASVGLSETAGVAVPASLMWYDGLKNPAATGEHGVALATMGGSPREIAASRLYLLPSGQYVLSAAFDPSDTANVSVTATIRCDGSQVAVLSPVPLSLQSTSRQRFSIPANCPAQRLILETVQADARPITLISRDITISPASEELR